MEIEYGFNIGDKLKVIYGGIFTDMFVGAIGVITGELSANGVMDLTNGFSLEIQEPEKFKGQVWRMSMLGKYELLEVSDANNIIKFKNTKEYKTIVRNRLISFEKRDYIEEDELNNLADFNSMEIKIFNAEDLICIKDCIYPKGTKVQTVDKFEKYVIVTDGKNENVFTYEELEECFTDCVDVNKVDFKVVSKTNSETDNLRAELETIELGMNRAEERYKKALNKLINIDDDECY